MLETLARNWNWLIVRAILATAFGVTTFVWPDMTFTAFVYLFGLYAIFDGMVALAIAIDVNTGRGLASLLLEALVRIGGGLIAMGEPGIILAFPRFLAGWAILTGLAEGCVAIVLRRELAREWPLPFAGAVTAIVGLLVLLTPRDVGVPALRWLVGPYAIIFGVTLLAFARRLRRLSHEMDAASREIAA
jgi:uncharacterized membrane protein HdeD (DUF308 family)